jgi:hypothetical protein
MWTTKHGRGLHDLHTHLLGMGTAEDWMGRGGILETVLNDSHRFYGPVWSLPPQKDARIDGAKLVLPDFWMRVCDLHGLPYIIPVRPSLHA